MQSLNYKSLWVTPSSSILEALKVMDLGAAKIVLVIDKDSKLVGTLTDGDIRRGLIEGTRLTSSVDKVMKKDFIFTTQRSEAMITAKEHCISRIPVLDSKGCVVELLAVNDVEIDKNYSNAVVIMAGGMGKRLWPYTKSCPKPMLMVDGKPILEILIRQCRENGFYNIYLSVNYLKEIIIDYFGDGSDWGVNINYLVEDKPLGTAGSLKMLPKTLDKPFLVMNGDVLTKIELQHVLAFHQEHGADATICVRDHEISVPFGVVETNGINLSRFLEKPVYKYLVNAGVYALNPSVLDIIKEDEFTDMPNLLINVKSSKYSVCVCPIHEYWIDVGLPETMKEANKTWNKNE